MEEQFRAAHGAGWHRQIDRLGQVKDKLILGIVGALDRSLQRGHTTEAVGAAVTEALGAELAPHATVISVKLYRLIVNVKHSAFNHPVRVKLEAAIRAGKLPTVKSVTVRVA